MMCRMRKLNGLKQVDPDPLRIDTSTLETNCQTHCEAEVLCHGFTYHTGDRRCVLHRYNRHLVHDSSCQYWAKTCPGYSRERTRVGELNWIYTVVLVVPSCKTMFSPSISWCSIWALLCCRGTNVAFYCIERYWAEPWNMDKRLTFPAATS